MTPLGIDPSALTTTLPQDPPSLPLWQQFYVRHYKGGRSSAICTGRLYPRRNPWYSFSEAESTPGHMVPSGGAAEKISSDTTGNRSQCLNHYATTGPSLPLLQQFSAHVMHILMLVILHICFYICAMLSQILYVHAMLHHQYIVCIFFSRTYRAS